MSQPKLTFACELEAGPLQTLFAEPAVIEDLLALGATVSLGILDLSEERAAAVRRLNEARVPVVAWQLLPKEQGYWWCAGNTPQAAARYAAFKDWTAQHDLRWAGIGVDIEPDFSEVGLLTGPGLGRLAPRVWARLRDRAGLEQARADYQALLAQMWRDGYPVEVYQVPFIYDERAAGSTLLQRLFGIVDVRGDRDVAMLYSSFLGRLGAALLWSYAPETDVVGVGSTGGGVAAGQALPTSSWEDLVRDLRLARCWHNEIFVFSLEGCVQQGYLRRLRDLGWDAPVSVPADLPQVQAMRSALRGVLWASVHPWAVGGGLAVAVWLLGRRRRR